MCVSFRRCFETTAIRMRPCVFLFPPHHKLKEPLSQEDGHRTEGFPGPENNGIWVVKSLSQIPIFSTHSLINGTGASWQSLILGAVENTRGDWIVLWHETIKKYSANDGVTLVDKCVGSASSRSWDNRINKITAALDHDPKTVKVLATETYQHTNKYKPETHEQHRVALLHGRI